MTFIERTARNGLSRGTAILLVAALTPALAHHVDHVLRVDHSGWPFREVVTPFTFSLLAYPTVFFALLGTRRLFWVRWAALLLATAATLLAHSTLESPAMQYAMWAFNRSLDPHAPVGLTNLLDVCSPGLGWAAVILGMALNVTATAATIGMLANGLAHRR